MYLYLSQLAVLGTCCQVQHPQLPPAKKARRPTRPIYTITYALWTLAL